MLTLTMPGSAGGRSPGVAGSLPVSRQAAGWAELPAGARDSPGGGGGACRAAATASSAWAHMDSTVWRWKEHHSRTWCWSRPVWPFPCWWHSSAGHSSRRPDQDRQRRRLALRDMAVEERQVSGVGQAAADQRQCRGEAVAAHAQA